MKLTARQRRRINTTAAARRAAHVAAGRRCDGKPLAPVKPCGCRHGCCLKCAKPTNRLYYSPELIAAMWADYGAGMGFVELGRKYGKDRQSIRGAFIKRGYAVRPVATIPKLGFGVKIPPATKAQIAEMIAGLKRLGVPKGLKIEWRSWSLARRHAFVQLLRKTFPSNRPTGVFSDNVTPFEYGTPAVHEIAARMNQGRTSQTKIIALKPCSEGVIYHGQIYFWDKNDSYVRGTKWTPALGRPLLKHIIWEEVTGSPVPDQFTVIQKDANKNNFAPENLALRSMADCARLNAWHQKPDSPERRALVDVIITKSQATKLKKARERTAALLKRTQSPQINAGLMAQLQRRKNEHCIAET